MNRILRMAAALACLCLALGAATEPPVYECNFESAEAGKVPADFLVLNGAFAVKAAGTNKFLELPGSPLDGCAVQFGPAESADVAVTARICGTANGKRGPAFGVGLGGAGGYRLQVSPGRKAVELLRDQELKARVDYEWRSGTWTRLRLQVRKVKDGAWRVEGKVWADGSAEPKDWTLAAEELEPPVAGRASVAGSPFSGTPIWFDDLRVERVVK